MAMRWDCPHLFSIPDMSAFTSVDLSPTSITYEYPLRLTQEFHMLRLRLLEYAIERHHPRSRGIEMTESAS